MEELGDINEDEEVENENENLEEASGSDEDDEDYNYQSSSQKIDTPETSTPVGTSSDNNFVFLSVSTTAQPTINKAVNSNSSRNLLLISVTLVHSMLVYHQN